MSVSRIQAREHPARISVVPKTAHEKIHFEAFPDHPVAAMIAESALAARAPCWKLCMFAEGSRYQEQLCAVGGDGKIECLVPGPGRFWPTQLGPAPVPQLIVSPRNPPGPRLLEIPVDPRLLEAGDPSGSTISSTPASPLRCANKAKWK
ncbi:hypothetical protein NKH41_07560 [Mesorhizobium sp. M1169]|uniref:hypothetical protein n=1 Tax=unclassified Mesorhizobium TaxID=325217 RepID=UPI003334E39F